VGDRPRRCFVATEEAGGMFGFLPPIKSVGDQKYQTKLAKTIEYCAAFFDTLV